MSEDLRPGEVDLEAPAPAPVVPPVVQVAADPPAEPAPEPESEPDAEPLVAAQPEAPKKRGLVDELIDERKERKAAQHQLAQLQPLLSRLTPDVAQAIQDGRVTIQPPHGSGEAERVRLEQVAKDLGLFKADNTPDLEAAGRVDRYVRGAVKAEVEPVRNMTLADKAQTNINIALAHAKANGLDEQIVREEYEKIQHMPNGAQMLSQESVAKTVWRQAMGRMVEEGKIGGKGAPAPAAAPGHPAAIIAEPTGRRGSSAAITLSPELQQVYRDHGLDPVKASATKPPVVDARGHMELE